MALQIRCNCGQRNSLKRRDCSKCGARLPVSGQARRYVAVVSRPGGQKVVKSLGMCVYAQARDAEQRLVSKLKHEGGRPDILTWGLVVEQYLRKLEADGANAVYQNDQRRYLRRMLDAWGDLPVTEITPALFRQFRVELLRDNLKLSKASCDRHHAAAKAAWNHSVDDLPNPFERVTLYNPDNQVTEYLSPEELNRLLDAARQVSRPLYEMACVAVVTGLRKGNILNLRRDEVDLDRRLIVVRQKRNRSHVVTFGRNLRDMLAGVADNRTPYFWISPRTGRPYHRDWRKPADKAKRLAGINPSFRFFHGLRHVAGTKAFMKTRDLRAAQTLLGHTNAKTTERYAHILPEYLEELADHMDIDAGDRNGNF